MKTERSDVSHPIWRKKVDTTILKMACTPLPAWIMKVWNIEHQFGEIAAKKDPGAEVCIWFKKEKYKGFVTRSRKTGNQSLYRLFFTQDLCEELKKVYIMSYMRTLESHLREGKSYKTDIEKDISFWEFVDIEYDDQNRSFYFTPYYLQEPTFPELFKSLVQSTLLLQFEKRDESIILKSKWLLRNTSVEQFHANNVIYYLIDTKNKFLYIGEADRMHSRFLQGHTVIPNWDYYRFDVLPKDFTKKQRVAFERMLIFCFSTLLENNKHKSPIIISDYKLANLKIDQ